MTDYFQGDIYPYNEDELSLSPEEQELAEDLALRILSFMSEYHLDIQFEAIYQCQELLDQEEKEEYDKNQTMGLNGVEYF